MSTNMLVVWTTVPEGETARSIAKSLVTEQLAACAQLDSPMPRALLRALGPAALPAPRLWRLPLGPASS